MADSKTLVWQTGHEVHEILDHLPDGARVLDLGARGGSFAAADYSRLYVVHLDIGKCQRRDGRWVQADAACLPFRSRTFDTVILNHSLEHFVRLKPALQEAGRVLKQPGAAFVAVPDARTLTDRIYRKLFVNSGGHVNLFDSPAKLAEMLSWYLGLPHMATRVLCSSPVFLNRRNTTDGMVRAQMRFAGICEPCLRILVAVSRALDRRFHTRTSIYGWALYFGRVPEQVDPVPRTNVCIRCGQAHASEWLLRLGLVRKRWIFLRAYACPDCGTTNLYTRDADFMDLK